MGCCNEQANALEPENFDPTQHVNFAKGMVLGVDDFKQEFAYLSGRDQWLVRDAIGYGTANGLRVFVENDGSEGPRLHVSAGSAFMPSGKHVCVSADQCAIINKWLAKPANAATVDKLLNPGSPLASPPLSPPGVTSGSISLFLTLCHYECTTRPVPIPGDPCRSDDMLMADSRIADDFRLELRPNAPVQIEEDALRDFVGWLRSSVQIVDTSSPSIDDVEQWRAVLVAAVQPWIDAENMSPPMSPLASYETLRDYLFDLSPPALTIGRDQLCEFLRTAFRVWATELRPRWMAQRCHKPQFGDQDCVLLARLEFDVAWIGGTPAGAWQIVGSPNIVLVDESTRPVLAHLRLLQEWMMCTAGTGPDGGGTTSPTAGDTVRSEIAFGLAADPGTSSAYSRADHTHGTPPEGRFVDRGAAQPYAIMAAGTVAFPITPGTGGAPPTLTTATVLTSYNGLAVAGTYDPALGGFRFTFSRYRAGRSYVVKITPWAPKGSGASNPFIAYFSDFVNRVGTGPTALPAGFTVTVALNPAPTITEGRLMIEVSQLG